MGNKRSVTQHINTMDTFRLRPLSACVRMAIAGGVLMGSISFAHAELPVPAQVWATMGSASMRPVIDNTLIIDQQTDRAILNWDSFNVGANNQVQFNQPSSSSIALNRIGQNDASRILGKITANGQIYLYNKNGFVFGKDSVVDVNTLVASTLNVSDEVFASGIVREFDDTGKAAFRSSDDDPKKVDITVNKGAQIKIGKNGRLIMAAPKVINNGSITADEQGQIILVASKDRVYLQPADKDSPFAGLLVEVGSGGEVINSGNILARQGNVTLAGFAINQSGRVTATTSVNVNGSIRLLAREGADKQSEALVATKSSRRNSLGDGLGTESKVTFDKGSLTQITADSQGGAAIDEQDQPLSYIEVSANNVHLNSGSSIVAHGGKVNITASNALLDPVSGNQGRIILDKGAKIDVSGTKNIKASIDRNVSDVSVQSYELRDSPLQKGGILQGETVRVDIRRKDTDIVDISGAEARFERGIKERLGKAGEINLTTSGDVIVNESAVVDISGGSIDYQDGYINTTKLLTDYGRIVDISDADPNEHYVAIYGVVKEVHQKWGVTKVWDTLAQFGKGRFEKGYTQGLNAGELNIVAPTMLWAGELIAGASNNTFQRTPDALAYGGSFSLDTKEFTSTQNGAIQQSIVFQTEKDVLDIEKIKKVTDEFPKNEDGKLVDLVLSTALTNKSGLQKLSIATFSGVTVAADADIAMQPGSQFHPVDLDANKKPVEVPLSQFDLDAGKINVQGKIYLPGGSINLTSRNTGIPENSGKVNLSSKSVLDVSGRWVNDFEKGLDVTPTEPLAYNGGSIAVTATGDLNMKPGSVIRVDGGAWLALDNNLTEGKAGDISLTTVARADSQPSLLHLDGKLSAYGLTDGGSLSLSSGEIIVGVPDDAEDAASAVVFGVENGNFDFAKKLGFSNIKLTGNSGGLTVKSGTSLTLLQQNRVLQDGFRQRPSNKSLAGFSRVETLPEHLRRSVDLTLNGLTGVRLETGSEILGDKEATIKLASTIGGIYADGLIDAPSGSISMTINGDPGNEYNDAQAIWLGEHASIQAVGTTRMNPLDVFGRRTGAVLDGGDVELKAKRGYVILEQGSNIDVSGINATLDLPSSGGLESGIHYIPSEIGSDAGVIALTAAEGAVLGGDFKGLAGSDAALGGRLDLALDRAERNPPDVPIIPFPDGDLILNVAQTNQSKLDNTLKFGDVIPDALNGQMIVGVDKILAGNFSDVRLKSNDEVRFLNDVNLSTRARIDIDAPKIAWSESGGVAAGAVNLNTAFLRIGSSLIREVSEMPVKGAGSFTAHSRWTELGGASLWDGFSNINLDSEHDLRTVGLVNISTEHRDYVGTMVTAADLNLKASQIYPSTLTHFTFAVKNNPEGQVTVSGNENTEMSPLSAGGVLSIEAPVISQNGVVKAPFGTVNLVADSRLTLGENSLTSVSGSGQLIPFGFIQGGLDRLYPLDKNHNLVFAAPPEKKLVMSAPTVETSKGSVVDLSGGGDLLAYEFLPGSGGSYDYLDSKRLLGQEGSYQGGFAIVPTLGADIAPHDHIQSDGFAYAPGSKVYLSGTAELPAGEYTILPARYALLPGAYLVTPQANTQDLIATTYTEAGLPVVSGYQINSGAGIREPRRSGYLIENGADIRRHSEYDEQKANTFYAARALKNETAIPILPKDSGQVSLAAQDKLALNGDFKVTSLGGRGARMDIAANRLKIVKNLSVSPTEGILEVTADDLSNLGVDSLFLGGVRSYNGVTGSTDLNVTSQDVIFDNDAQVSVTDLVAAAKNTVEVRDGAVLAADGSVNTGDKLFNLSGDGALLRVSADNQVKVNRTSAPGNTGELRVHQGATLAASKSMLLDASKSTVLTGNIQMNGGSLNLSANAINIGEVSGLTGVALNLSNEKLHNLAVDELVLSSRDTVNFYGNVGQADGSPISFDSLVIDAAGFSGFSGAGQKTRLDVGKLQLQHTLGDTSGLPATGQGILDFSAKNFVQGSGDFSFNGFQTVNLNVGEGFNAIGKGELKIDGDLNLISGYITAAGGSDFIIDAGGHKIQLNGNGNAVSPESVNLGGAIALKAGAIDINNARVLMPSGALKLQARSGDVFVGGQADINLAGQAISFADTVEYTPGGVFSAVTDNGKITLAKDSVIRLDNGGGLAKGGQLILKAPKQVVDLLGDIDAATGSAELDVSGFSDTADFDSLMKTLTSAGISESIHFRTRDAEIVQASGNAIKANTVVLAADKRAIALSGTIDANGSAEGGTISLFAGGAITLENGAALTATGAKGGEIKLSSVDNASGINIKAGSLINVSGSTKESGGEVSLRALRVDSNNDGADDSVNIQPIAGTVLGYGQKAAIFDGNGDLISRGYSKFYAEGVRKYNESNFSVAGEINSNDIDKIKNDTADYMAAVNTNNVNDKLGAGIHLRPGIEINYSGDLALNSKWDLVDWRYNDSSNSELLPGILTLAASGKLNLKGSISDGFKDGVLDLGNFGEEDLMAHVTDLLQTGDSWSYQITAGADFGSAETGVAVIEKDLTIGSDVTVRTGTGDINLNAGGNIVFTNQTSTVYNAGRPEDKGRFGTLSDDVLYDFVGYVLYSEYPVDGGDLIIKAGKNIEGAVSNQFIDSWLLRIGSWADGDTHQNQLPTAWGVALGYTTDGFENAADATAPLFQQNIGSFGGGKVNISASGNINDLSVMMPTTGKQVGVKEAGKFSSFLSNEVQIQGGGEMQINAGGNIAGGAFYLGKGDGVISSEGGIIGSNNQFVDGPQLVMGDSNLVLNAKSGISVSAVSDAMVLHSGNEYSRDGSNFFSYSDSSGIAMKSLSGDVHIGADTSVIGATGILGLKGSQKELSKIYPASLKTTAFGGSVLIDDQVTLFPSPSSNMQVFAKENISSVVDSLRLSMSDADKMLLPSQQFPLSRSIMTEKNIDSILNPYGINELVHAAVPLHTNDSEPVRIVTHEGDIRSIQINVPKIAVIQSGNDLYNVLINVQHVNVNDASIVSAERDIRYTSERDPDGILKPNFNEINIAGPGDVLVKSGRDIDFGASGGLSTVGNLLNSNLSTDVGANIVVLAGLNTSSPDYSAFLDIVKYSEKYTDYKLLVTDFMRERTGESGLITALLASINLSADDYAAILSADNLNAEVYAVAQQKLDVLTGGQSSNVSSTDSTSNQTGTTAGALGANNIGTVDQNTKKERFKELLGIAALHEFKKLNASDYAAIQPQIEVLVSKTYADQYAEIMSIVTPFMKKFQGDPALTDISALEAFSKLSPEQYLPIQPQLAGLVNQVFFNELKVSGSASAESSSAGNVRGFGAIETLFPGADWNGNLSLFFSKLQTLQGGNIDLLVPGGEINAGLAVSFEGAKAASELGIVAQGKGDINAFVHDDFIVNQSRVFALSSGDILIWSSEGDIDAGRGAKSAIAAPPPEYSYDDNGNLVVTFPPIVSGSGIRTAATAGNTAGDVFLFAPKGVVNAGEAGIGGTNVTISATAVLGANNIQVGGIGTGVPAASTGSLAAGLTGVSNLTASVSQVAQASADMGKANEEANNKSLKLGVLSVDVIGYGD